jgi:bifunctional DNA primase/polymerase-like protein
MREITGKRRLNRSSLRHAALTCATRWRWPVVPGATAAPSAAGDASSPACSCADADCVVPGAHPGDPGLLAATADARMVGWWWDRSPDAPVVLATGTPVHGRRSPCAVSLPAVAGERALAELDRLRVRLGPVLATPTRCTLLVRPYDLAELGELLYAQDVVPSSLRFHGAGGYVALPPSCTGLGRVGWVRPPVGAGDGTGPWLPQTADLLDVLVEATLTVPEGGSRLAY